MVVTCALAIVPLAAMAPLAFQPPHSANRHDAGCRGAGVSCVVNADDRMRFRKLRIAWSVGCGIACVLLIVLWVRSYTVIDSHYCRLTDRWTLALFSSGEI